MKATVFRHSGEYAARAEAEKSITAEVVEITIHVMPEKWAKLDETAFVSGEVTINGKAAPPGRALILYYYSYETGLSYKVAEGVTEFMGTYSFDAWLSKDYDWVRESIGYDGEFYVVDKETGTSSPRWAFAIVHPTRISIVAPDKVLVCGYFEISGKLEYEYWNGKAWVWGGLPYKTVELYQDDVLQVTTSTDYYGDYSFTHHFATSGTYKMKVVYPGQFPASIPPYLSEVKTTALIVR